MDNVRRVVIGVAIKAVILISIGAGIAAILTLLFHNKEKEQVPIDGSWEVRMNGTVHETDDLSAFSFSLPQKGDRIELAVILPKTDFKQASVCFFSRQSVVHIYIDGQEVYEYGEEYAKEGLMVGSGENWVELPVDYAGRQLRIVLDVQEDQPFSNFRGIYLQDSDGIYYNLISDNLLTGVVSGFLLCFGWVLLVVTVGIYSPGKNLRMLFWIAGFSILLAQWLLCYSGLIEILIRDLHVINTMEYTSLYLAPVFMLFFICDMLVGAPCRRMVWRVGMLFVVCDAILLFLHYTNLVHFPKTLNVFHTMVLFCGMFVTVVSLKWAKRTRRGEHRIFAHGIVIFVGFSIADIIRYSINRYANIGMDLSMTLMQMGVLVFVIMMTLSLMFRMMEYVADNIERKTLVQMAYTDALTNIKNRASCEQVFQNYDRNEKPLTIINMDLNGFKEVNDAYGHAMGDELLMRFATALETTFLGKGFVGRMGGDEFIVILDYCPKEEVQGYMDGMMEHIDRMNRSSNRDYRISVSYGYADNYGKPSMSAWKVYEEADHHMYENKKQFKEGGR